MARQSQCTLRFAGQTALGKAFLDESDLSFAGEPSLRIPFPEIASLEVVDGTLLVTFSGGLAEFQLGRVAGKWAQSILHPPTLLDRLGVTPGMSYRVLGALPADVAAQLPDSQAGGGPVDAVLLGAATSADLDHVPALIPQVAPRGALWIIYPKRVQPIRELQVLEVGRTEGLIDTEALAVSPTHVALRFAHGKK